MGASTDPMSAASGLAFTGATIDRAGEIRHDPEELAALLSRADAVAVTRTADSVLVDSDGTRLARTPWQGGPETAVLLGIEDGHPLMAATLGDAPRPSGTRPMTLRDAGGRLPQAESGLAAYLMAMLNWHDKHPHCSVCGTATHVEEAGLSRKCPNCGTAHFPRTDPVVIMTVESEGRLLMGSRTGWPAERFSVLAGFVSPGETPEEAVIREVREESGIEASGARYVTAQPWPFPASLMLGFHAVSDGGDPAPRDHELSSVRWFSRDEVMSMQKGDSPLALPPDVSIARLLIDQWVAR